MRPTALVIRLNLEVERETKTRISPSFIISLPSVNLPPSFPEEIAYIKGISTKTLVTSPVLTPIRADLEVTLTAEIQDLSPKESISSIEGASKPAANCSTI